MVLRMQCGWSQRLLLVDIRRSIQSNAIHFAKMGPCMEGNRAMPRMCLQSTSTHHGKHQCNYFMRSSVKMRTISSEKPAVTKESIKAQSQTHLNRFKDLWRKYGLVAIGTYFTMYGIVLGSIYISIENGLISKNRNTRLNKDTTTNFDVVSTTNK